ncbi:hypothetical protein SAMN04488503_2030 [Humidesulfovibrio mexicanus]|uniref:Uncharacterized protein n=1 Tax=Humidesulfovibrio mexicanus TaxID=147047 RepID=A0A239AK79_9BACT|nr:hypothetical protein [Humidesulfovibrio mexicanus]SNR95781.1 hypothetical protein SAMN04488503_2030 [Humidesulfovibrio mexicanus]
MAWRGLEILGHLESGSQFTFELARVVGITNALVRKACAKLAAKGLIITGEDVHELTAAGREALAGSRNAVSGPGKGGCVERHKGSVRAKAWRALRIRRKASVEDLLPLVLGHGAAPVDEANARRSLDRYLTALAKSGHLTELPRRGGPARWILTNDTGPCAPAWNNSQRTVTDANTGEVHRV